MARTALSGVARGLPRRGSRFKGVQERPAARLRPNGHAYRAAQSSPMARPAISRRIPRQVDLLHHPIPSIAAMVPDKRQSSSCVRGADLMIYDSSYTDEEYPRYRGLGPFDLGRRVRRVGGRRGCRHARRLPSRPPATTTPSWTAWRAMWRWLGPGRAPNGHAARDRRP